MIPSGIYTEKELLLQVAEGNELAFKAIYDRYKTSFHSTAFKMTRSNVIAEDIVQEVFITLWKKRAYLANSPNPVGYLMTMLHNAVFYHFRKVGWERDMKEKIGHDSHLLEENPVEELLLAKEYQALLHTVVGQLTSQQQIIYRLSRQEGLSREEIAEKLHLSPNTVRNHLNAALTHIKTYFRKGTSAVIWAIIWANL